MKFFDAPPVRFIYATLVLEAFAAGCGFHEVVPPPRPSAMPEPLRNLVAYDFECPAEKVVGRSLGESTTVVKGCGKEAIYLETCRSCAPVVGDGATDLAALPPIANHPCGCTYERDGAVRFERAHAGEGQARRDGSGAGVGGDR